MTIATGAVLTRVSTTPEVAVGTRYVDYSGKVYKYFRYKEGAAATDGVAGEVAYFYAPSGTSAGATTDVTSDLSDSAEVGAGVLQANMSDNEYGWFQVSGPATLSIALTAGADGDNLCPTGAGDGTLDVVANDAASGYLSHVCAQVIDADAKIIMCRFE